MNEIDELRELDRAVLDIAGIPISRETEVGFYVSREGYERLTGFDRRMAETIFCPSRDLKVAWAIAETCFPDTFWELEHVPSYQRLRGTAVYAFWHSHTHFVCAAQTPSLAICRAIVILKQERDSENH